ncbi:MAG: InlB B-repeat-containing protein, partial [Firmicutes bacterium]|nr:InlB B-repeat-containing protein [Bacillota bacterium]
PPPNVPEPGEWDMYLKDGALDWDAINEGLDSGDIDHNLVMMLLRDYGSNSGNTLNPTPAPEADAAAATAISRQDNIIISAMLVDFCDDPFNIYIAPGSSSISYTTLVSGGIWFGGGLSNANLQKINQVAAPRNTINNKYYEVISYGKMDMANPNAKYDSYTADRKDRVDLEPGKFYDLSLYLQPNLYKVKAGHTLALVLFAYYPGFGAGQPSTAQGQYAITIDNTATYASIPLDLPKTFDVTFFANGQVYDEQEVIMGQKAIVPDTPQKARYIFNGWFTDETGGVKWDFSKAITADLNLYAQWTKYDFTVFLAPQKTSVNVGETFYVDIMLEGSLNYTQVFTEINYDTDLLEFAGFSELQGWVAAVNKIAPNLVSVRSMPSMNMLMGEPCFEPIKIVTLAFNAKDNFNTASITTDLGFSSVMVTPPGGYLGAIIDPGNAVTLTLNK